MIQEEMEALLCSTSDQVLPGASKCAEFMVFDAHHSTSTTVEAERTARNSINSSVMRSPLGGGRACRQAAPSFVANSAKTTSKPAASTGRQAVGFCVGHPTGRSEKAPPGAGA